MDVFPSTVIEWNKIDKTQKNQEVLISFTKIKFI